MATAVTYVRGAELPPLLVQLLNETNDVIDLTAASAFVFKMGPDTSTTTLSKTTGITGSTNGALINWASGDLDGAVVANRYLAELSATVNGLEYRRQFTIQIDDKLA